MHVLSTVCNVPYKEITEMPCPKRTALGLFAKHVMPPGLPTLTHSQEAGSLQSCSVNLILYPGPS